MLLGAGGPKVRRQSGQGIPEQDRRPVAGLTRIATGSERPTASGRASSVILEAVSTATLRAKPSDRYPDCQTVQIKDLRLGLVWTVGTSQLCHDEFSARSSRSHNRTPRSSSASRPGSSRSANRVHPAPDCAQTQLQ